MNLMQIADPTDLIGCGGRAFKSELSKPVLYHKHVFCEGVTHTVRYLY